MKRLALALAALVACGNNSTAKQPDGAAAATTTTTTTTTPSASNTTATSATTTATPTTTNTAPATAASPPPMLADDVIKQAVTAKQEILIVRVTGIEGIAPGSRSETTTYVLDVVRAALGTSKGSLKLSHYGAPKLEKGKVYAVTTRDGNPMWGTKGLRESVEIPAGQEEAAAKAHADKAKTLGGN
jgi:hypothetical protein